MDQTKRLKDFLRGFHRAWLEKGGLKPEQIAGIYAELSIELSLKELGAELTRDTWLELMGKLYDKKTRH